MTLHNAANLSIPASGDIGVTWRVSDVQHALVK